MTYLFEGEEHAALRTNARRFAATHIAPHAHAWEEANEFPRELYRVAGAFLAPVLAGGKGRWDPAVWRWER